ncbi:MAG: hypothetical protein IPL76_00005, partial [Gemmatimonadetes bacterium]|nr:hypothetical protein [Gemmatimonadota bacterium]
QSTISRPRGLEPPAGQQPGDTYTPFDLAYEYDADGARIAQRPTPVAAATVDQDRRWFYDAMGRQAGYKYVEWSQGEARLRSGPQRLPV